MTELLQNEQLGCSKTSSRYGEVAEEMGVQRRGALSGLARGGLTAFDLCSLTGKLHQCPPNIKHKYTEGWLYGTNSTPWT
jgi:hypothetical protein